MKWLICSLWAVPVYLYCDGKTAEELGNMFIVWFGCAVGAVITCEIFGVEI